MAQASLLSLRKKEGRGKILTILLMLLLVYPVLFLTSLPSLFSALSSGDYNAEKTLLSLFLLSLMIISAIGIWKWSKYGVYALILLALVWLSEYFLYELPSLMNFAFNNHVSILEVVAPQLLFYLIEVWIYFWSIKRKWHLFS